MRKTLLLLLIFVGCMKVHIGDSLYHHEAAFKYHQAGDYQQAIYHYLRAIEMDSVYAPLFSRLAECYYHIGKLDSARYYWNKAQQLDPNDYFARANLYFLKALDYITQLGLHRNVVVGKIESALKSLLTLSSDTGLPPELVLLIAETLSGLNNRASADCGGKGIFLLSENFARKNNLLLQPVSAGTNSHVPSNGYDERQNPIAVLKVLRSVFMKGIYEYRHGRNLDMLSFLQYYLRKTTCFSEEEIDDLAEKILEKFIRVRRLPYNLRYLTKTIKKFNRQAQIFFLGSDAGAGTLQGRHSTKPITDSLRFILNYYASLTKKVRSELERSQLFFNIGVLYFYLNDYQKAEFYFLRAQYHDPQNINILYALARLAIFTGEYAKARNYYSRILSLDSTNWRAFLEFAELEIITGNIAHARELLERSKQLNNGNIRVQHDLAIIQFFMGDTEAAVRRLEKIANHKSPMDFLIYYHLGLLKALRLQMHFGFQREELGSFTVAVTDTLRKVTVKIDTVKEERPFIWPVEGFPSITSFFGWRPNLQGMPQRIFEFHTGLDIDGATNDPILAAADGVVIYAGWKSGYGKTVELKHIIHGKVFYTSYHHLSKIEVSEGQQVHQGERIGRMGATGKTTGDHLHFDIEVDGKYVDPLLYLKIIDEYAVRMR